MFLYVLQHIFILLYQYTLSIAYYYISIPSISLYFNHLYQYSFTPLVNLISRY